MKTERGPPCRVSARRQQLCHRKRLLFVCIDLLFRGERALNVVCTERKDIVKTGDE